MCRDATGKKLERSICFQFGSLMGRSMRSLSWILALTGVLLCFPEQSRGQLSEGLSLFGYVQTQARYSNSRGIPGETGKNLSFSVQQMNLFLNKQINNSFNAFIDLEFTNNFSHSDNWGNFRIEEAWVRYNLSQAFRVKAGILVPTFNQLNTFKNRTPLLPYIIRPIVYESYWDTVLELGEFIPEQGSLEVYGLLDAGPVKIDYSTFVGNESGFISGDIFGTYPNGNDSTFQKVFGGRLGARFNSLRVGFSYTRDRSNMSIIRLGEFDIPGPGVLPRNRIGLDFSYRVMQYYADFEYIRVNYEPSPLQVNQMLNLASLVPMLNSEINKEFLYFLLGLDIRENWYVYSMNALYRDEINDLIRSGVWLFSGGGGYRPDPALVLKLQMGLGRTQKPDSDLVEQIYSFNVFFAISVFL